MGARPDHGAVRPLGHADARDPPPDPLAQEAHVGARPADPAERDVDHVLGLGERAVVSAQHAQADRAARARRRRRGPQRIHRRREQRHGLDREPRRSRRTRERRRRLGHPLDGLAHAQPPLARAHRPHVGGADGPCTRQPPPRPRVEPPRDPRNEQRERPDLLHVGRRPRRRVEVGLDALQQSGVRAARGHDAAEPAAILRRSSASSSVASSTPCSRATSRSVRPLADASLTISAALS